MADSTVAKKQDRKEVPLMEHLNEFRRRLIYCAIVLVVTTGVSFLFADRIIDFFESRAPSDTLFIVIEATEKLGLYMKVCLYSGVVLALPFFVFQLVMFIRPALTGTEKKYLYILLPGVIIFFFGGAAFTYYLFLPPALDFMINFSLVDAEPQIRLGSYISMVTKLLFVMGLIFELPLVIYFFTRIGIVGPGGLSKYRRYAYVGAFVVSAIVTPTIDPINQTIVAIPIIILYELGILFAKIAVRQRSDPKESTA